MLRIHFDEFANRRRNEELSYHLNTARQIDHLREQVSFYQAMSLWLGGVLFVVVCFLVAFGWS